jgi:hypothetical protein
MGNDSVKSARLDISQEGLLEKIALVELNSWMRAQPHRRLARRWHAGSVWASWAAAFTATISSISIFVDYKWAAFVLSLLTAAVSAFLASVRPADHAKTHTAAAVGFTAIEDAMRDLGFDLKHAVGGGPDVEAARLKIAANRYDEAYARFEELKATTPATDLEPFPL